MESESTTQPTSWRSLLKVHPAAEMFPLMAPDELKALAKDIRKNGLRTQVVIWVDATDPDQEYLLDGRNRLDALEALGYRLGRPEPCNGEESLLYIIKLGSKDPPYGPVEYTTGNDPYKLAVSYNIERRHLTTAQKSELLASLLKANPERSDNATAKLAKVSDKTVGAKRKELEATSEIPKLDKRTGADGKARKQPTKATRAAAKAVKDAEYQRVKDEVAKYKKTQAAMTAPEDASPEPVDASVQPADPADDLSADERAILALKSIWEKSSRSAQETFLKWAKEQLNSRRYPSIQDLGRMAQNPVAKPHTLIVDAEPVEEAEAAG